MRSVRTAFDPDAAFVAASGFPFRGKRYAPGDPFPWRELGMPEHELRKLWLALKVDCSSAAPREQSAEVKTFVVDGKPVTLTAGERVDFAPPAEKLSRAERRAQRRQG